MSEEKKGVEIKTYRKTILDELHDYWNGHVHSHLAHTINLKVLKKMNEKDVWEYKQMGVAGSKPIMNPILVKDVLPEVQKVHDKNLKILTVISELIDREESKSSVTSTPYDFNLDDEN